MLKIKNILIMVLMSAMMSGVCAQTSKTKRAEIQTVDSLAQDELETDRMIFRSLLHHEGDSIYGCIAFDGTWFPETRRGDEWTAYLSYLGGNYYYLIFEINTQAGRPVGLVKKKIKVASI